MPTCTSESLSRVWPSNESIHAGSTSSSSGFQSPSSPNSLSPISTSPDNTLRRRRIRRAASVGTVIQEPFVIRSDCRDSRSQSPVLNQREEDESFSGLADIIGWYPCFLLRIGKAILLALLPQTWRQLIFALPMLWISMWVWFFTQLISLPLTIIKLMLSIVLSPGTERNRKKRTVLISGGSTIQALHLARNFYSAGARVVVCEVDGLFALTRFSTAVSRFYTVPKPTSDQQQNYVRALCEIVDKEQAVYYIPVSSTTSAYFDAVAKPHLELLGCNCFCPGIKEVWALDDTLEVLKRCQKYSIPIPTYYAITSREDVYQLYDTGAIRMGRYVMTTAGPSGLRERSKMILPVSRNDLKLPNDISEQRPWVVVQDVEGDHFLTCTTVKESQVIANVTCRMDKSNNGLVPIENKEINSWLSSFFSKLNLLRPITGHVSFRFVIPKETSTIVPLSSRVGVSLPYICYTSVHPRLLWKPCRHFSRQNSGPLVNENGRYWMSESVMTTIRNPNIEAVTRLIGTVIDKREALFAIWDPLPYCAYYHMLLPFRNMLGFMQRRQDSFPRPMTNPVR
ncbi:hypothetical protein MTP99_015390 [Tenebrio molitor]|jgi:hypothetical protein|uniref:Uncharacterized protein n=1 Tax=Tenebrio molitor TaxID=7067 RepID=A0A8J6H8S6_TENMO|nr:hypothetical protein GEV33_012588 [Tenebrio molitor]KAJ3628064.1 hypothetical protein MTP99_015390 [Tenebrio molitor]CAH1374019.1 unnamed protein product [Tenebrio molitor]